MTLFNFGTNGDIVRAAERGEGGAICPRALGSRGLTIEDFSILTSVNVLKCILSQSKGLDEKCFVPFSRRGPHFAVLPPGPPESLGGPGCCPFQNRCHVRVPRIETIETLCTRNSVFSPNFGW